MRYIIHRSLAASQDAVLNNLADQVFAESSDLSKNLSSENQLWLSRDTDFEPSIFQPKRIREMHVVFLSGLKDLSLIEGLKKLPKPPCVIWSGLKVCDEKLDNTSAAIDIYVKHSSPEKEGNVLLCSAIDKEDICLGHSLLQEIAISVGDMAPFQETLFKRLQFVAFRMHAASPNVIELEEGKFAYKSILVQRRHRSNSDSTVIDPKHSQYLQQKDENNGAVGALGIDYNQANAEKGRAFYHIGENELKDQVRKISLDAQQHKKDSAVHTTPWSFWKSTSAQVAAVAGAAIVLGAVISHFRSRK